MRRLREAISRALTPADRAEIPLWCRDCCSYLHQPETVQAHLDAGHELTEALLEER
jgi:hypothetical protein